MNLVYIVTNIVYLTLVFIMQQLKSMGVLIHPNLNRLDIVKKVVLDSANAKYSCSASQHNIYTIVSQQDNM